MSRTEPPGKTKPDAGGQRCLVGIAVSSGIAIGPLYSAREPALDLTRASIAASAVEAELARLEKAIAVSRKQLAKLRARLSVLPEDSQQEMAPMLDAYTQMLTNSRLVRHARKRIAERLVTAETAVHDEAEALAGAMLAIRGEESGSRQRRADEVRETGRRLLRNLSEKPFLLCDGGTGSRVQAMTLDLERDYWNQENCTEILNLSRPDLVRDIARGYFAAGADMVETNTFGGSPITLAEFGLEERAREINRIAAELAREAADEFCDGRQRYVLGGIGPGRSCRRLAISNTIRWKRRWRNSRGVCWMAGWMRS